MAPSTTAQQTTGHAQQNNIYPALWGSPLDRMKSELISGYVAKRREMGISVTTINRELQVLRRMFKLAIEWGKVDRILPAVRMLPGERRRERAATEAGRVPAAGRGNDSD